SACCRVRRGSGRRGFLAGVSGRDARGRLAVAGAARVEPDPHRAPRRSRLLRLRSDHGPRQLLRLQCHQGGAHRAGHASRHGLRERGVRRHARRQRTHRVHGRIRGHARARQGLWRVAHLPARPALVPVKAICFDVFGTVVDWRTSVIEQCRSFGREKKLDLDWEAFVDRWRSCYRPGMDAVRTGSLPWTNVAGIHRAALEGLLDEYPIRALSENERLWLNGAWNGCAPWPDAVPGLARLKAKYVLSTLSNADVAGLVEMAKGSALPWDCILCAEFFRHYKPDAEVYL